MTSTGGGHAPPPAAGLPWPQLVGSTITALDGGLESTAWVVDDGGARSVLKLTAFDALDQHRVEVRVLNRLEHHGLARVPRVLHGPAVDQQAGGAWTLLSWVDGRTGTAEWYPAADAVGRMLRTVHDHLADELGLLDPVTSYDGDHVTSCCRRLVEAFGDAGGAPGAPEALVAAARLAAGAVDDERRVEVTVLHADVHGGNVAWDGLSPGLLDFGRCGAGPGLLDVAMAQSYLDDTTGSALARGYRDGEAIDAHLMSALRFAAALDNLATLAEVPAERAWVAAQIPSLVEQGRRLRP